MKTNYKTVEEETAFRFSPRPNRADEIPWRLWGKEAFDEARLQDKPIFLCLSAIWCHWCHVLDETTFSNPEVISLLEENFIPVRVDADQNPHIESRYIMGGWPTVAFLDHEGRALYGGTYIPPESFITITTKIKQIWETERGKIDALPKTVGRYDESRGGKLGKDFKKPILGTLMGLFDDEHGGFGQRPEFEPKFPLPDAVDLLLMEHHIEGEDSFRALAQDTLDAMMKGEVWDDVEGGFFRYATKRDWSTPHYEKMLKGNAGLLRNYSEAARAFDSDEYSRVARGIVEYVSETLWDVKSGAFYSSQDADEVYFKLDSMDERDNMESPYVDPTHLTNWSAEMVSALAKASMYLDWQEPLDMAKKGMNYLTTNMKNRESGLYYHSVSPGGKPHLKGYIADQAWVLLALEDLYEATADRQYLEKAEILAKSVQKHLKDPKSGSFNDLPQDTTRFGMADEPRRSFELNSLLALGLARLSYMTAEESYLKDAKSALEAFAGSPHVQGQFAAIYGQAAEWALNHPVQMVVVAKERDETTNALVKAAQNVYEPRKVLIVMDSAEKEPKLGDIAFPANEKPALYVCNASSCSKPIENPAEVAEQFSKFMKSLN